MLRIVAASLAIGIPAGAWFGWLVTGMYARLFHFPEFLFRIYPSVILSAVGVSTGAAVIGALGSVIRATRLAPAEAMRPATPRSTSTSTCSTSTRTRSMASSTASSN